MNRYNSIQRVRANCSLRSNPLISRTHPQRHGSNSNTCKVLPLKRYYPSASTSTSSFSSPPIKENTYKSRNKSSSPNEAVIDDDDNNSSKSPKSEFLKLDPRAIFPWRHSTKPLPRLVPNTPEFDAQGGYMGPHLPTWNAFVRGLSWINATGFLGGRLMNYFGWKEDLEEGFQLAFAVAVQGLLLDVYRVSNNDVPQDSNETNNNNNDDDKNTVDDEESTDNDEIESASIPTIQYDFKIDPLPEDQLPTDLNHDESINSQTRNMLDSHLISLYKTAHECMKHKLHIHLQSTPKSAQIMSLLTIPFLTKDEVINKPALKHSFRNIWKGLQQEEFEKGSQLNYLEIGNYTAYQLDEMANRQMIRRGDGKMQVTVIAQVAIQCDEIFKVVDVESGQTIQGDPLGEMKEVTHLVRFEMVVDLDARTGTTQLGSWQITDWDDLLDGNVWFL